MPPIMIAIVVVSIVILIVLPACYQITNIILIRKRGKRIIEYDKQLNEEGFCDNLAAVSLNNKFVISVDKINKQWCFFNAGNKYRVIFPFSYLESYRVYEDNDEVIEGRTKSALIGGAFLGTVGAIAGGSGSRKVNKMCNKISIVLEIKSDGNSTLPLSFNILNHSLNRNSDTFKNYHKNFQQFQQVLNYIITNQCSHVVQAENLTQSVAATQTNTQISRTDEIEKLFSLKEKGIITEEEFESAKRKLLSE